MIDWLVTLIVAFIAMLAAGYGRYQREKRNESEERRSIAEDKVRRIKAELQLERNVRKKVAESMKEGQERLRDELAKARAGDRSHFTRGLHDTDTVHNSPYPFATVTRDPDNPG